MHAPPIVASGSPASVTATVVLRTTKLNDGTPISASDAVRSEVGGGRAATTTSLVVGSSRFSCSRVVTASTEPDFAAAVVGDFLNQSPGETVAYVLCGSDVTDSLLLELSLLFGDAQAAAVDDPSAAVLLFAAHNGSISCETLLASDLRLPRAELQRSKLSGLRGISVVVFTFRSDCRAVVIASTRISLGMIAVLPVAQRAKAFLSIGADLTAANAAYLIEEYEALVGLLQPVASALPPGARENTRNGGGSTTTISSDAQAASTLLPLAGGAIQQPQLQQLQEEVALLEEHVATLEEVNTHLRAQLQQHEVRTVALLAEKSSQTRHFEELQHILRDQAKQHSEELESKRRADASERDELRASLDALRSKVSEQQTQISQLSASNRAMETRILVHQKERDDFDAERSEWHRQNALLEVELSQTATALQDCRRKLADTESSSRRELLEAVIEFQRREKEWQRELVTLHRAWQDASQRVADLEVFVQTQSKTVAAATHAAEMSHVKQARELDELLRQVRAVSPLGKLQVAATAASSHKPLHSGADDDSIPVWQRSGSSSGTRRTTPGAASITPPRHVLSPTPGDRWLDV